MRLLAPLICAALLALPSAASAQRPFTLGVADAPFADPASPLAGDPWTQRAVDAGVELAMLGAHWNSIAPVARPAGFDATDPASPGYRFEKLDAQVRTLAARGIRVGITTAYAPGWATGKGAPKDAVQGAWKPSATEFGRFARALGKRYDGTYPDPLNPGATIPAIHAFQAWSEPNLESHLAPLWSSRRTSARPLGPAIYRRLLNAFYAGIKAEFPQGLVVTAGTAPFGDPVPGTNRMGPVRFWRETMCLKTVRLRPVRCAAPPRFDALSHHPYSVGPPERKAFNTDDVSLPDLHKLTRVLRRAEATGRALPRKRHRLWVTEFSFDSSPPDPDGVPAARHARWLAESFQIMWRQGVDTVNWFLLRDQAGPPFDTTYQSGIYRRDGALKPATRAFRFPFTAFRRRGRVAVWARVPATGTLRVQRRRGGRWVTVASRAVTARSVRTLSVAVPRGSTVRGVVGDETSISWRT